jgi:MoxR-like ATPase
MIEIRLAEAGGNLDRDRLAHDIFAPRFLLKRPLLEALSPADGVAPVLLIDELDRTDEPFEAYLLEVLAEYQVTIPELGAIRAVEPPVTILTSNRTREIHDAIKRRCLYHWVGYPDAQRELAIVRRKCPLVAESLAREIVAFTQRLRAMDLYKAPGIAETLDWAEALATLDRVALDPQTIADTAGVLLKYQDDIDALSPEVAARLVAEARVAGGRP